MTNPLRQQFVEINSNASQSFCKKGLYFLLFHSVYHKFSRVTCSKGFFSFKYINIDAIVLKSSTFFKDCGIDIISFLFFNHEIDWMVD